LSSVGPFGVIKTNFFSTLKFLSIFLGNGRKYRPIFISQIIQSCVTEVFKLSFLELYIILQLQVQIVLLNQKIMQIGNKFRRLDDWDKTYSVLYQKEISEGLQIAIEQHCAIKKYECKGVFFFFNLASKLGVEESNAPPDYNS
jgi:hypothetical protein